MLDTHEGSITAILPTSLATEKHFLTFETAPGPGPGSSIGPIPEALVRQSAVFDFVRIGPGDRSIRLQTGSSIPLAALPDGHHLKALQQGTCKVRA